MCRLLAACLTFISFISFSQEQFVSSGDTWKFHTGVEPGSLWSQSCYDDALWSSGKSPLGYGNNDDVTMVTPGGTAYFRRTFMVNDPRSFKSFTLNVKRDDGVVIFLNGIEVYRNNMPLGVISHLTAASSSASDNGTMWQVVSVDGKFLMPGVNVIAAEVHQSAAVSNDMRFDLSLKGIVTEVPVVNELIYKWVGALQPTSVELVAKLASASTNCRAVVSTSAKLTSPVYSRRTEVTATRNYMAKMKITGLLPNTLYYYAIESNGTIDKSSNDVGTFTTPVDGAFSYRFVVASCAVTSDHQVYTAMKNKSPLFYLSSGDLHYGNPNSAEDVNVHRSPYEQRILAREPARYFFNNIPFAYMWDDHDYSGDGSNYSSAGRVNARKAYQEMIPHYPLVAGSGDVGIFQAFTIGRVRFILSDLRSERSAQNIMSDAQKVWFKSECLQARDNKQIIAWVSGVSFGGTSSDNWGGYKAERTELSNFFRDNKIRNMFILSGDAHMVAIDNGSNHDFSTGTNNPSNYPVFQAAALNNKGSTKGGTYSEGGTFPNPDATVGQYGVVDVFDDGGPNVNIKFTAYRTKGNSVEESILTSYTFMRWLSFTTMPSLSARQTEGASRVQLSWDLLDVKRPFTIERSSDKENFVPVHSGGTSNGHLIDQDAQTGWNYYVLRVQGKEPVTQYIFIKGNTSVELAPNPASGIVRVHLNEVKGVRSMRYILYNMKMKTELQGDIELRNGENTFELDVTSVSAGEYILNIVLNGLEIPTKLVVVK
jgi:hypothetical protein